MNVLFPRFRHAASLASFVLAPVAFAAGGCSSSSGAAATTRDAGGAGTDDGAATEAGSSCSAAIAQTLKPIDSVSKGAVTIVSDAGGVRVLSIDATAGGPNAFANDPYVYVNLETGTRVDVTDKTARASVGWDLALKRYVIYTNGGDGGGGQGGATHVSKAFSVVTGADATGFATESFFDADCNAKNDAIGGLLTTFSDWFTYDQQTNRLAPAAFTYVVQGGTGKHYKVGLLDYYGAADGGTGGASGELLLEVAPL
jgi:HmuY protein